MKQYLFLATAIATASLFTGCSNNEYVGDQPEAFNGTDGAIAFSMGKANTTRGTLDAATNAEKLNGVFYVYGTKTVSDAQKTVFDTYKVKYTNGSTSASNTKGWEYVLSAPNLWQDSEKTNVGGGVDNQTIKYWDYSASKYTFYAFSAKPENVKEADPKIKVSNINTSEESYTVTIKNGAEIKDLYFADKKVVDKADYVGGTSGKTTATGAVQLTFRNLASKIRVGFYETVPGYSIQIKKMYPANDEGTDFASDGNASVFMAICPNTVASQDSKITVKYSTESGKINRAYVKAKNKLDDTNLDELNTLTLGSGVFGSALQTTSSSPTWDNGGNYTFFWPQDNNSKPLKIKVDYTLTATDQTEDSKKETINVKGATATVPADYVKWAANTAYTYIFKISDNTNGTTGSGSDPAGLYPITFDAAVVDMTENTYLTTVSTPSVTAKQDGTTAGYVTPEGIVFQTGTAIVLKVAYDETPAPAPVITGGYIVGDTYNYDLTPEENLTNGHGSINSPVTLSDGKKLEAQTNAGYWVLKVTYSNTKTDVFTYVIIRVGNAAEQGPENPANP